MFAWLAEKNFFSWNYVTVMLFSNSYSLSVSVLFNLEPINEQTTSHTVCNHWPIRSVNQIKEIKPVGVTFFLLQAPWPVNIVIDSSCQKLYNLVFLFLLKLKQAKWSLDEFRFSGVVFIISYLIVIIWLACVRVLL